MNKAAQLKMAQIFLKSNEFELEAGINLLKVTQEVVSSTLPGCIPDPGVDPTPDQLRTYFLALNVELGELLQELNWKPWKESKAINKARVVDEFADVLAFTGILLVYLDRLGITTEDLAAGYAAKTSVNIQRLTGQVDGYKIKKDVPNQQ